MKYKKKYNQLKEKQKGGVYFPSFDALDVSSVINNIKASAHEKAYDLLKTVAELSDINKIAQSDPTYKMSMQIATAESLTAGLMFSTLVDIPFGGAYKYGCFGVYDTDAKRIFINVNEPDVYTHNCARQMAIGILLNSNATIGIAVTGNAMPIKGDESKVGEVFIGIATYIKNPNIFSDKKWIIKVTTSVHNFCLDNSTCKLWNNTPLIKNKLENILSNIQGINKDEFASMTNGYNDFQLTSLVAQIIRNSTTSKAFELTKIFLEKNKDILIIPDFINEDKINNWARNGVAKNSHDDVIDKLSTINIKSPNNKLTSGYRDNYIVECENQNCDDNTRINNDSLNNSLFK